MFFVIYWWTDRMIEMAQSSHNMTASILSADNGSELSCTVFLQWWRALMWLDCSSWLILGVRQTQIRLDGFVSHCPLLWRMPSTVCRRSCWKVYCQEGQSESNSALCFHSHLNSLPVSLSLSLSLSLSSVSNMVLIAPTYWMNWPF